LNGKPDTSADPLSRLPDEFTVETWVWFDPTIAGRGRITAADGILGAPGTFAIHFYEGKPSVWTGEHGNIAVSTRTIAPLTWAHIAVTCDSQRQIRIYQDGELVAGPSKPVGDLQDKVWVGKNGEPGGMSGLLAEFRVWEVARTQEQINASMH